MRVSVICGSAGLNKTNDGGVRSTITLCLDEGKLLPPVNISATAETV